MDKLLEVREFEKITKNSNFKDIPNYRYLPEEIFENLITFIREYVGDEDNADILDFMRISYKRNVGDIITVKNYVGLIQLKKGYQIQILPKISFNNDKENKDENIETKKIFIKMLRSMKNFPCKVFDDASLKVDRMNLYEIFINMYIQEVNQLVKHGIKSAYVEQEDNLRFYKGKLQVSKHLRKNIVHKECFYVLFDEFNLNRPENKLVKATLLKLQKITTSAENSKRIRQLLMPFEMVESSTNYQKDFAQVVINRNTKDYETLMRWGKVFLMNKGFTTFSGKDNSRALLFPMEKVYESYVAQQMKKIMCPDGWTVLTQDKRYYLFDKPRLFALKPDIVLQKDKRVIVMDTKWKKLINNKSKNYGISQSDMYQMYTYSKKYKAQEIWLLYPFNNEMKDCGDICFSSNDNTTVNIFFVDVANIEESLGKLKDKLGEYKGNNDKN